MIPRLGFAVAVLMAAAPADATPTWPIAPYTYFADNESLTDVLQRFAGGFSLTLKMAPGVAGLVNGKFNAASPTEFLDKLAGVYGFNWFVYAGTLFVSPASAMVTKTISVGNGAIAGLRQALDRLGVIDDRFGWGELPEQGLALVSGPPDYVALIERTIKALPPTAGRQEVAVFRLKYASVNDRTVRYRDQEVRTPGLVTILRDLVEGSGPGAGNAVLSSMAAPLRDSPLGYGDPPGYGGPSGYGGVKGGIGSPASVPSLSVDGEQPASARASGFPVGRRSRQATIQADPRLNAIIVQDIPERMAVYRSLIEQLDVPTTLIEIEVMIVDVSADATSELGVQWGAKAGKTLFGYGNSPAEVAKKNLGTFEQGLIGVTVGNALMARLTALQDNDDAKILSKPSILTADNMGALIDLSKTFYIKLQAERYADARAVTYGTSLRVTPRYIESKDGHQIELTVDISDDTIKQLSYVDGLPEVRKSSLSTLAVVGEGQALVIGGYNSSEDGDQVSKVPLLGDIPVLGTLFSYKKKVNKRLERVFVIRPRVVQVSGAPLIPESLRKWGDTVGWSWDDASRSTVYTDGMDRTLRLAKPGPTRVLQGPVAK